MKTTKNLINHALTLLTCLGLLVIASCGDDDPVDPMPTGNDQQFTLAAVAGSGISGTVKFEELDNDAVKITLTLSGTAQGESHPSHIHFNTAAESGGIALSLTPVDGATGISETIATSLDDGTVLTYEQIMDFDGYINVHKSASDLATLVAQGDIGQNVLTGTSKQYSLGSVSNTAISGTATLHERANAEALLVIELAGTASGSEHPAHIHDNTAAEGGGIAVDLSSVVNGVSKTNIAALNSGTAITYTQLLDYDGYINVHNSSLDLGTLVAQGDIGQNELTGTSKEYALAALTDAGISGTATFHERVNDETLVVIALTGDAANSDHPIHIHDNTAAEGGGIAISLTSVMNGSSKTNVAALDQDAGGTAVTYSDMTSYDGYINIHNSGTDLSVITQGDIGQNELTGESEEYALSAMGGSMISGTATFHERVNNETLVVIEVDGDASDSNHPIHIHDNTAAEGGGIAITLTSVMNGWSKTNVTALDQDAGGTAVTYSDMIAYDGYINIHNTGTDLSVITQGDIGQNELTGSSEEYALSAMGGSMISGTATFHERVNNETLVVIAVDGDASDSNHPIHIHDNTAAEGGGIAITLTSVVNGSSKTNVTALDDNAGGTAITYAEMIAYDGYINIHNTGTDLSVITQGDIGQNELTGMSATWVLAGVSDQSISGTVMFEERVNGETLVTISLVNTPAGEHPTHIHNGNAATSGAIAITLTSVDGDSGSSKTNVTKLDGESGAAIDYDALKVFDGYINVHSSSDLSILLAQGNIGSNG
ncbi:MAG: CHRD domain-containing protein [Cyclobacteriaceae bacterium]